MTMNQALSLHWKDIVESKITGEYLRVVEVKQKRDACTWNRYIEVTCKNDDDEFVILKHKDIIFVCSWIDSVICKHCTAAAKAKFNLQMITE